MRVLYVLGNYPKISETYVSAEINFMLRSGVRVDVWTKRAGSPDMVSPVPVHTGTFLEALRAVQPDLVHVHYLIVGLTEIMAAGAAGIPVTVRGHSYDFSDVNVKNSASSSYVQRIYLFPHFAARFAGNKKVMAVPVGIDSTKYQRVDEKEHWIVLRTCAAKPTKGIADFLKVAALCPSHRFVLLANSVNDGWMPTLRKMVKENGRVELHEDVPNEIATEWTRKAGIYLDTNDPASHDFGMPISIAESMATGSVVLVRGSRDATDYIRHGGYLYWSVEEAATRIRDTASWDMDVWKEVADRAVERAADFADHKALAPILADWRALCDIPSR